MRSNTPRMSAGPALFVDSDGVFAAFDEHVLDRFGASPQALGKAGLWQHVDATPDFWSTIPVKDGARALWDACRPHDPVVLTGCPKTGFGAAAAAKRAWWKRHFDHAAVIPCFSREKPRYLVAAGDVLVDDNEQNVERWIAAGGHGVLHRSPAATIAMLRQLLKEDAH